MRSVMKYLKEERILNKSKSSADHLVVTPEEAAIELQKCEEINNEWNAKCEAIRNARLNEEFKQRVEIIERNLERKLERDDQIMQEIEERVKSEKASAVSFITAANLEQAIEYALSNPVDVNFAIDLKKNIHQGRTGLNFDRDEKAIVASS